MQKPDPKSAAVVDVVREKYGAVAAGDMSSHDAGVHAVARAFGYSAAELASIPAEANMGLSCGNPTAFASLRPGEVVVDLGCGGGLDVFLAAQRVGPTGRAIGIDMTPEMIARANQNKARAGAAAANTEFHHGLIDALPLAVGSADVIISNCVINLAPDKRAVFREMFRVLRPGGRVAVSDIALKQTLPPDLAADLMAYVGCIAGAIMIEDYRRWLTEAGFAHVVIAESGADLNAYANVEGQDACCAPPMSPPPGPRSLTVVPQAPAPPTVHGGLTSLLNRYNVNDYAASVKVYAVKP